MRYLINYHLLISFTIQGVFSKALNYITLKSNIPLCTVLSPQSQEMELFFHSLSFFPIYINILSVVPQLTKISPQFLFIWAWAIFQSTKFSPLMHYIQLQIYIIIPFQMSYLINLHLLFYFTIHGDFFQPIKLYYIEKWYSCIYFTISLIPINWAISPFIKLLP